MQDGRRTPGQVVEDQFCNMGLPELLAFLKNTKNSPANRKQAADILMNSHGQPQAALEHTLGTEQARLIFPKKKQKIRKTGPQGKLRRDGGRLF